MYIFLFKLRNEPTNSNCPGAWFSKPPFMSSIPISVVCSQHLGIRCFCNAAHLCSENFWVHRPGSAGVRLSCKVHLDRIAGGLFQYVRHSLYVVRSELRLPASRSVRFSGCFSNSLLLYSSFCFLFGLGIYWRLFGNALSIFSPLHHRIYPNQRDSPVQEHLEY